MPLAWANLLGHFVDILINERLYRDLHDAESVNGKMRRLDELVKAEKIPSEARDAGREAYGWRRLEIVQIRPPDVLPGNPFTGFFDAARRSEYIEAGRRAAEVAQL